MGYCYSNRVMYLDREIWLTFWNDNFDSDRKLWKVFAYEKYQALSAKNRPIATSCRSR